MIYTLPVASDAEPQIAGDGCQAAKRVHLETRFKNITCAYYRIDMLTCVEIKHI